MGNKVEIKCCFFKFNIYIYWHDNNTQKPILQTIDLSIYYIYLSTFSTLVSKSVIIKYSAFNFKKYYNPYTYTALSIPILDWSY